MAKPHLNVADTKLFFQVPVSPGLGQAHPVSFKGNLCQLRIGLVSTMLEAMF